MKPRSFKVLNALLFAALSFVSVAHARVGSPTKIRCDFAIREFHEDIQGMMDINDLFEQDNYKKISLIDATCDTYENEVTTCQGVIENEMIYMRYNFNTQSGGLELQDLVTGQSSSMTWLNQHDVTQSGYLLGSIKLTNRRGGLLGQNRIFQIEAGCWALEWK